MAQIKLFLCHSSKELIFLVLFFENSKISYQMKRILIRSPILRSLSDHAAEFIADGLILTEGEGVDAGRILAVGDAGVLAGTHGIDLTKVEKGSGLLLPAFFDTHFHWVQDDVREMPKASLIEWLQMYTFPEEAKYGCRDFAQAKADYFWKRILAVGTVGGLCYSSIHEVALEVAMEAAPEDFKIGNVLMTMNCPESVRQTPSAAIASVKAGAQLYGDRYLCSPRFAPTTLPDVMKASALVAGDHGCFQQTHLGETLNEVEWVLAIYKELPGFEDVSSYTDIYQRCGMLGLKTIFGHCIYLDDSEWELMAQSGSRIASCPTSNAPIDQLGLGSGLFDFQKAEDYGVPWALASDIGGGPFLSMFDVMRSFVMQNEAAGRRGAGANYTKALHRSSAKGAELMDIGADRGMIAEGYFLDAIKVKMPEGRFDPQDADAAEALLRAVVEALPSREASDHYVEATYIKGQLRFAKEGTPCV